MPSRTFDFTASYMTMAASFAFFSALQQALRRFILPAAWPL